MTGPYILQARELLANEIEKRDCHDTASNYRKGCYDDDFDMTVLARVLREHAEFRQQVSDAVEGMFNGFNDAYCPWTFMHQKLDRFIAPKVDPLVEAMDELEWCNPDALASDLRKALSARGLEIREVQG